MKIISKYKDYYDFLTGIYGVDNKIVLDRRKFKMPVIENGYKYNAIICGIVYDGYYGNDRFYWGDDLKIVGTTQVKKYKRDTIDPDILWVTATRYREYALYKEPYSINIALHRTPYLDKEELNKKLNCPILVKFNNDTVYEFPRLSEFEIGSILPPKEIYLSLCEWLSPKDNISSTQTNEEKILSNGFDLKTSFRNIK